LVTSWNPFGNATVHILHSIPKRAGERARVRISFLVA